MYVTNPDNWVEWIGNHGEIDDISYIIKAFKAGAQWKKEQMMKDAVEGQVLRASLQNDVRIVSDKIQNDNLKINDRVKIIVIKED